MREMIVMMKAAEKGNEEPHKQVCQRQLVSAALVIKF